MRVPEVKPAEFFVAIGPAAQASAATSGVPASFVLAQGALESAWGESKLARGGCNLFGVKADAAWQGEVLLLPTREYLQGQWVTVQARWRKYPDWLACIDDHAAFLRRNKRYRPAFTGPRDGESFARAVAAAGYATDPAYADKVVSIIRRHGLAVFDQGES